MIRNCSLCATALGVSAVLGIAQAQERTGAVSQGLVTEAQPVDQQTRRELGLLTLRAPGRARGSPGMLFPAPRSVGCTAALLNDYWAITASHCVEGATAPDQVTLSADWAGNQTRQASEVRSLQWTNGLDIALVMINTPFPRHPSVTYPRLSHRPTSDLSGQRIESFGRGISQLARVDPSGTPQPSVSDQRFRSSDFEVFRTSAAAFTFRSPAGVGRSNAGGDSGGPSYFRVWDDPNSPNRRIVRLLAGVHSTCHARCLPGKKCDDGDSWRWVESIPDCSDASVETVRTRIEAMIAAVPDVHRTSNDFDHDGRADILWHNAITGESQVWLMKEASRIGRATILADANPIFILPPWHIVGTRDFEGDGATDVLWHNATSGETQVWLMNGYVIRDRVTVLAENGTPALVGPPWSIVGTNDFDQNRTSDILWHNGASGETQIWRMNGHRITHRVTVVDEDGRPILVGQPWSIVGTNDFDRNDAADIVWHNATTGETQIWRMNGHRITHRVTVVDEKGRPILVGAPWKIVGTDYFDPDKAPDILWHNETTGETQIWYMREWSIGRRVTVDARHDGGGHLVGPPWRIMNH